MEVMTTNEAAKAIGVGAQRIRAMVASGQLRANRFGRALAINANDVAAQASRRKAGPLKRGYPAGRAQSPEHSQAIWESRRKNALG